MNDIATQHIQEISSYGATTEEWDFFRKVFNPQDLLPYVANPKFTRNINSAIKSAYKVPTVKADSATYRGFLGWQEKISTPEEVDGWSLDPDYGICCVARTIFAIDIDIEDQEYSDKCLEYFRSQFTFLSGRRPLVRSRSNSGKCLLVYRLKHKRKLEHNQYYKKFVVQTPKGVVECLFQRQQFSVAGTHKSGVRYEWKDTEGYNSIEDIPAIKEEQFCELMNNFISNFAIPTQQRLDKTRLLIGSAIGRSVNSLGADLRNPKVMEELLREFAYDPEASAVIRSDAFITTLPNGGFAVDCPYHNLHTQESSESATAYFPAAGGLPSFFRCLHESHGVVSKSAFLSSIGYTYQLPKIEDDASKETDPRLTMTEEQKAIARSDLNQRLTKKQSQTGFSRVEISSLNLIDALKELHLFTPHALRYESFSQNIQVWDGNNWRILRDEDYTQIHNLTLRYFNCNTAGFHKQLFRDSVQLVSKHYTFDRGYSYVTNLPEWDGVDRIATIANMFGYSSSQYVRAVLDYMFTAIVARLLAIDKPVKADMMPVLVGAEGLGKSTFVRAIAFDSDVVGEFSFKDTHADIIRLTQGKSVVELSELDGISRVDGSFIKAYITRVEDSWVKKFQEAATTSARRFLIIGTTNNIRFITHAMGTRRWLPVRIHSGNSIDIKWVIENRDKIYAQAYAVYKKHGGIMYEDAERLAGTERSNFVDSDVLTPTVVDYLESQCNPSNSYTYTFDLYSLITIVMPYQTNRRFEERMINLLNAVGCGYEQSTGRWSYTSNKKKLTDCFA